MTLSSWSTIICSLEPSSSFLLSLKRLTRRPLVSLWLTFLPSRASFSDPWGLTIELAKFVSSSPCVWETIRDLIESSPSHFQKALEFKRYSSPQLAGFIFIFRQGFILKVGYDRLCSSWGPFIDITSHLSQMDGFNKYSTSTTITSSETNSDRTPTLDLLILRTWMSSNVTKWGKRTFACFKWQFSIVLITRSD